MPLTTLPLGLSLGLPLGLLLPLPSDASSSISPWHPMHPPYQHYPARIEKDFDGRWLEGEACDLAEEVVGAQCRPRRVVTIKGSLIRRIRILFSCLLGTHTSINHKLSYWFTTLCCKCQWGWTSGLSNGNLKGGSQSCRIETKMKLLLLGSVMVRQGKNYRVVSAVLLLRMLLTASLMKESGTPRNKHTVRIAG